MNTDKPVVMQVLPELETGGVERGTVEIASFLKKNDWDNIVVSSGGTMVRELEKIGVEHITLNMKTKNPLLIWHNIKKLQDIIKSRNIGIVHARSRAPAWSAFYAAKREGVKFVTTFHGTYGFGFFDLKKKYNVIMTKGDRIIAISNFIAKHISDNYGIDRKNVTVVHRGVDTEKFEPTLVSGERIIRLAKMWRVPEDKPIIMLPGRLTRWKGQMVLVEAISLMNNQDFRCLLVGSDQGRKRYRRELEKMIKQKSLESMIHIIDNCDDMMAAYMLTDIVVSASTDPEAFGRVIIEGQAMGRVVVATAHGGACETIEDGKTGFLVPPSDPQALAEVLTKALTMESLERKTMTANAVLSAKNNFSKERMCETEIAVYRELANLK